MIDLKRPPLRSILIAPLFLWLSSVNASEVTIPHAFQSNTPALAAEVNENFNALDVAVDDNDARIATLEASLASLLNRVTSLEATVTSQASTITSLEAELTTLNSSEVMQLNDYLSVDIASDPRGPLILIEGANLQLANGSGVSNTANGLGNLIVGYDEVLSQIGIADHCSLGTYAVEQDCEDNGFVWANSHKSGSHNVIVGSEHSYSQTMSIVAGSQNVSANHGASVLGGHFNWALGTGSAVVGGSFNTANGASSVIVGGEVNNATGIRGTILGGFRNTASDIDSTVVGGDINTASGPGSVVLGGRLNNATGDAASISGGLENIASGNYSSVSGGNNNEAGGESSTIGGGRGRSNSGDSNWTAGTLNEAL